MPANDERKLYPILKRTADEKKLTSFYRAANKIRGIPDLGAGSVDDLVEVVADFLPTLCRVDRTHRAELWSAVRQAEWVIDQAVLSWKKWLGPAGLREIYTAEFFPPTPTFATTRSGPIAPDCSKCSDQFTVLTSKADVRDWCDCARAKQQQVNCPELLDLINKSAAFSRKHQGLNRPRRSDRSIRKLLR